MIQCWPDLNIVLDGYFGGLELFEGLMQKVEEMYNNKEDQNPYQKYQAAFDYIKRCKNFLDSIFIL